MRSTQNEMTNNWFYQLLITIGVDINNLKNVHSDIFKFIDKNGPDELSAKDLQSLLASCSRQLNNEHIGVLLAENTHLSDTGLYGYLLSESISVEDFLHTAVDYYPIIYKAGELAFNVSEEEVSVYYSDVIPTKQALSVHDNVWSVAFFWLQISSKLPEGVKPAKVFFSHPPPKNSKKLHKIFGEHIFFNQAENGFVFDRKYLKSAFNLFPSKEGEVYKSAAKDLLEQIKNNDCLESRIRLLILNNLPGRSITLSTVSKELYLSESTLKRRIKALDLTFKYIKDDVILYIAKKLLTNTDCHISQISSQLGFSEHSSFNHFFTRLTDESPSDFRQRYT